MCPTSYDSLVAHPTDWVMELDPDRQERVWQDCESSMPPDSRWGAYLNQLVLETILERWADNYEGSLSVWPQKSSLYSIWAGVDGTAVVWQGRRLVLIPSEDIDNDEFRVPQEWVDIPEWAADYYVAVQLSLEDEWIRVWGFATHQTLKSQGDFDDWDRAYVLEDLQLVSDLNFLVTAERLNLGSETKAAVQPIAAIEPEQAEQLLQRLGNRDLLQPRLDIPFHLWAACFIQNSWRNRWFQQRLGGQRSSVPTQISQWLQGAFSAGWQALSELEGSLAPSLTTAVRTEGNFSGAKAITLKDDVVALAYISVVVRVDGRRNDDDTLTIVVRVLPMGLQQSLPHPLALTFLNEHKDVMISLQTRGAGVDEELCTKELTAPQGSQFTLQLSYGDVDPYEEAMQL